MIRRALSLPEPRAAVYARGALLVSILLLPITKNVELPLLGPRLTAFDIAAWLAIVLWFGSGGGRTLPFGGRATRWTDALFVLFLAAGALSGLAVHRLLGSASALVAFGVEFFTFVYLLLFFIAARAMLLSARMQQQALAVWLAAALLVAAGALIGGGEMWRCHRPLSDLVLWDARVISTFRNPNQLAAYMVAALLLFGSLWLSSPAEARWRFGCAILLGTGSLALLFSGSRGGLLALPVAAGLLVAAAGAWRRALLGGLAVTALVLAAIFAANSVSRAGNPCTLYLTSVIDSVGLRLPASLRIAKELDRAAKTIALAEPRDSGESSSRQPRSRDDEPGLQDWFERPAQGAADEAVYVPVGGDTASAVAVRMVVARHAIALWKASPILGVGLGTMHLYVYQLTGGQASVSAHSTPLTLLAETGVIGMSAFFLAVGVVVWGGLRAWRRTADPWQRGVVLGLLAALAGVLVMGLSFDAQRQRLVWLLLAWLAAAAHTAGEPRDGRRAVDAHAGEGDA